MHCVSSKLNPVQYDINAMYSGLFLRTLEHIQLTVYATVSYGGLLYSGGSEKIIVYYDFTVSRRGLVFGYSNPMAAKVLLFG